MTDTEEHYSNRQIERLFDQQSTDLKEEMRVLTTPILIQTTKTNGRVTDNEKDISKLKIDRGRLYGALGILMVIVIPVFGGYLLWLGKIAITLQTQQAVQSATIQSAVDQAFANNLKQ